MSQTTNIEWCDSTFNPWMGCTRVSPACDDCFAARSTPARTLGVKWGAGQPRRRTSEANWALPRRWAAQPFVQCPGCGWRGEWREADQRQGCCPACGRLPKLFTEARRRVFCASLADWLDNEAPIEWLVDLLDLIRRTPELDWLLLSKRIGNWRMRLQGAVEWLTANKTPADAYDLAEWVVAWCAGTPPGNVWVGATVVNQLEADRDIPKLLAVPARVRFLSIEPMLGPIDLRTLRTPECVTHWGEGWHFDALTGRYFVGEHEDLDEVGRSRELHWVITGGESGPKARPMHPDWARSLRDQCAAAGLPFLFKQWGEWCPRGPESLGYPSVDGVPRLRLTDAGQNGQVLGSRGGNDVWMNRAGKKAAGRLLDGRKHDGFPKVAKC